MAAPPGHAGEPVADVLGLERRAPRRVAPGFGRQQRVLPRPGRLLELEGATLADAAVVGAGEPAAVEELAGQRRWSEAADRRLHMGAVGQSQGADPAVAPGLPGEPVERVLAVLGLVHVLVELALGAVAAPAVLQQHGKAVAGEPLGDFRLRQRQLLCCRHVGMVGARAVVRRAFQQGRPGPRPGWPVDVGSEVHTIAHRHAQAVLDANRAGTRRQRHGARLARASADARAPGSCSSWRLEWTVKGPPEEAAPP